VPDISAQPPGRPRSRHAATVPVDSPSRSSSRPTSPTGTPAPVSPAAVSPAAVSPAAVSPAAVSPAAVSPAPVSPAARPIQRSAPVHHDDQPAEGDGEPDPRRWKALAVCLVAVFMTLLDVSIVNVALPDLSKSLGASSADLQWVLSGYALTFGLVLVPAGRLGDIRSRRTAFLVSVSAFVLASAACGVSQGPTFLVVARLVQGMAAGALTPQVSGLIQELFSGRERAKAFGYFGSIAGVSLAVGPLLGGLLILLGGAGFGWRLVFYVNLPIGVVALILAYRLLPQGGAKQRGEATGGAFDPLGTVLLGLAVVSVLLPLVEEREWAGWHKWLLLVLAAVLAVAFVLWERRVTRRGGAAAVDLTLFAKATFASGNVLGLIYFAGFTSVFFVWSIFLQDGHGYPAWKSGLATVPFALGSIVTSRVSGRFAGEQSTRLIQLGTAMFCVAFAAAVLVVRHVPGNSIGAWLAVPLLLAGLGSGLILPSNQTSSLSQVDVRQAGVAGAVFQTSLRIGTALGIAVIATVFYNELADTRGDYSRALQRAFSLAVLFGALTFAAALVQGILKRRAADHEPAQAPARPAAARPALDD
jgi:EmrB/QacA subfamily drug resistance transporter